MMQNYRYRSCLQMLFVSLVAAFVTTSCTKEDLSQCNTSYVLRVEAFDAGGGEIAAESIKDIALYVFDTNKEFLGVRTDAVPGRNIALDYPEHDQLTVVAWGNAAQGNQTLPTLAPGDKMETAFVSLLKSKAAMGIVQSPNDLFYGSITLHKENRNVETMLPIYRSTAGAAITARRLKQYANAGDENFTYVLRQTGDQLNFEGKEDGVFSAYQPEASFTENKDEFTTPIFNILATTSNIEVDIFHGDVLVATILKSPNGKPLKVEAGKVLNILVDFAGDLSVIVSVTKWGEKHIWKEFN